MFTNNDKKKNRIIVALDVDNPEQAIDIVDVLFPTIKIFKVGSQLFSIAGPDLIKKIQQKGAKVFLDLKFFDIPNTVAQASKNLTRLGVFMFNMHCMGGTTMLEEAAKSSILEAEKLGVHKPIILGVTILTSMDIKDLQKIGFEKDVNEAVIFLASLAKKAGLCGVVCSAKEAAIIKQKFVKDFICVCPGIRPSWSASDDQKRITTPKEAFNSGADYIVVGRPVIAAENIKEAAEKIVDEVEKSG